MSPLAKAISEMMQSPRDCNYAPDENYNECREVEDFLFNHGLWEDYCSVVTEKVSNVRICEAIDARPHASSEEICGRIAVDVMTRSTAKERCEAAIEAFERHNSEPLNKIRKLVGKIAPRDRVEIGSNTKMN